MFKWLCYLYDWEYFCNDINFIGCLCTPVVSGELTQSLLHIPCAETTYDKLSSLPKLSNNLPVEDFLRDEIVNEQFTRYES